MKIVNVTVNGKTYKLYQTDSNGWSMTQRAPTVAGEYPVTVTFTQENGKVIVMDGADPDLAEMLTLFVINGTTISGKRMLEYYPPIIQVITEFQALMLTEGFEFDFLASDVQLAFNDAYLTTMSEDRIKEWEQSLGITPLSTDTLENRRDLIISKFRGGSKLNTESIASIVNAFTQGTATSSFSNGTLTVEIRPPEENKSYKFSDVEKALSIKVPAHILLNVIRDYATWGDIKANFTSWETVKALDSWNDLATYLPPQEG